MTLLKKILFMALALFSTSLYSQNWLNLQKKNGLVDNYVKKLFVYKNELWAGTSAGVSVYNLISKEWKTYNTFNLKALPDNFINDIFIDDDYIWIATAQGLAQFNKKANKWSTFNKQNGLPDNFVTCIYSDKENYWFGTQYWGVSLYSKNTKSWSAYTTLDGLAGNKINCINGVNDEIWFGTKNGVSLFRYYAFIWKLFTSANTEFGLARDSVLSLIMDGDEIWCGTEGEGISKYDEYSEKWIHYNTSNKLLDDFILSMAKDGENIWIGTFGGITLFNKYKNSWENFRERNELPELSITSIVIDGDYAWFGSAGGGITRFQKEKPQIEINHVRSGYASKNLIKLYGTIFDYDGIKKITITYRKRNENLWFSKGITLLQNKNVQNDIIAQWDTKNLLDAEYIIKLDVFDNKGDFNSLEIPIKIDTLNPVIYMDKYPEFVNADKINITGTYFEDNLIKIMLKPEEKWVATDKLLKTFSVPVNLKEGENKFELVAEDIALQTTTLPFVIVKDTKKPVISIVNKQTITSNMFFNLEGHYDEENINSILITPFNESPDINFQTHTFSKLLKLNAGKNLITCVINDKAGNSASAKITVNYITPRESIVFDNFPDTTSSQTITLTGIIQYPNITSINAFLNQQKQAIDFNKPKAQFSLKLNLEQGENNIVFVLVDNDNKNLLTSKQIFCDSIAPQFKKIAYPLTTDKAKASIIGEFIEPNFNTLKISAGTIIQAEQNKFEASLDLKTGPNKIKLTLTDKLGLTKSTNIVITLLEQQSPIKVETKKNMAIINTNMVVITRDEYKKLMDSKTISYVPVQQTQKQEFKRIALPDNPSLVLAPYSVSQGDSIWDLSKSYYGTSLYADYIEKFNQLIDPNSIKSKESIFIPTLKLIRILPEKNSNFYIKILSLITFLHFNYGYFDDMQQYDKYLNVLFSNYGLTYKKLLINYSHAVFLMDKNELLVFSRVVPELNTLKELVKDIDINSMHVLIISNNGENEITCNFINTDFKNMQKN